MTLGPDLDPELQRPLPVLGPTPTMPGYEVDLPVRSGMLTPGVHRWRGRRRADGLDVMVTCLAAAATPQEHTVVVERVSALSRVRHPHLVSLRDIVTWPCRAEEPFSVALVTAAVEVESLESVLRRRGPLSTGQALSVLCPVAEALAHLHQHGLVHGALTAAGVQLTRSGMPMLADAGAHEGGAQVTARGWSNEGYAAPEVVEGFPLTRQSDAYALAALIWCTLAGRAPGSAGAGIDTEEMSEWFPPWLAEMLRQGLGSDPDARPRAEDWLGALPNLGRPAPVDLALDVGADLPHRLRVWSRQPATDGDGPAHRATRPLSTRVRIGLTALILLAVLTAGAWVARPWSFLADGPAGGSRFTTQADSQARTAAPTPASVGDRAAPASTGDGAAPASTGDGAAPASTGDGAAPASIGNGPEPRPAIVPLSASGAQVVLQSVLKARGRAWESGFVRDLDHASLAGSAAWRADRDALELARARDIDFERVRFRAMEARVLSRRAGNRSQGKGAEMVLRARVRRDPLVLQDARGDQRRYPATTETVVLTLRRSEQGWRLYDWG